MFFTRYLKKIDWLKNKETIDYTWEYVEIKKETEGIVKMYEVEVETIYSYDDLIFYKNLPINYKNLKKINHCRGYCCDNIYHIDNKSFRSKEKQVLNKMKKFKNYELEFFNKKYSWYDYC